MQRKSVRPTRESAFDPKCWPTFQRLIKGGKMMDGLAADDGVALHFIGKKLARVVSSRPDAGAFRVKRTENGVEETKIVPNYLGKS